VRARLVEHARRLMLPVPSRAEPADKIASGPVERAV
jgi:hypothetical protein